MICQGSCEFAIWKPMYLLHLNKLVVVLMPPRQLCFCLEVLHHLQIVQSLLCSVVESHVYKEYIIAAQERSPVEPLMIHVLIEMLLHHTLLQKSCWINIIVLPYTVYLIFNFMQQPIVPISVECFFSVQTNFF